MKKFFSVSQEEQDKITKAMKEIEGQIWKAYDADSDNVWSKDELAAFSKDVITNLTSGLFLSFLLPLFAQCFGVSFISHSTINTGFGASFAVHYYTSLCSQFSKLPESFLAKKKEDNEECMFSLIFSSSPRYLLFVSLSPVVKDVDFSVLKPDESTLKKNQQALAEAANAVSADVAKAALGLFLLQILSFHSLHIVSLFSSTPFLSEQFQV
jgi:hypothetical protein